MRLKEIEKVLLEINFSQVGLKITSAEHNTPDLENIIAFKDFLQTIEKIEIYQDEVDKLKQSSLYETTKDTIEIKKKQAHEIYNTSNYLVNSSSSLKLVFNKLLPSSTQESISIKLPEPSDFEELNKTMLTIQKSISQIITHEKINGITKINNWEFGSFWIDLALNSQAAVMLISSAVWSAAVISKKFNEDKLLEEQIRAMKIKNDSLDDILNSQKELTSQLVNNEAQSILDKHFDKDDNEQFERIKSTIKTFAKLIQNGAEIHPSLMAPEKVQNLFPNFKELDKITSNIKQIEDKSEDNEEVDI